MGKDPQIVSFDGTHVTVRRSDGALLSSAVSPYPIALYGMVIKSMWEQAIQLCRSPALSTPRSLRRGPTAPPPPPESRGSAPRGRGSDNRRGGAGTSRTTHSGRAWR
jgi:hypothetical protein